MTMPAPDITQNGVPSLLQYCVLHVVKRLDFEPKPDCKSSVALPAPLSTLADHQCLPAVSGLELELGLQIWKQWTKYG